MNSILTKQKIVVGDVETMLKKEEYSTVYRMARDLQTRKVTDERFDDKADGYCDESVKEIHIKIHKPDEYNIKNIHYYYKKVLRHEIVHAFFFESGLHDNALDFGGSWSVNEEMVDWIAYQFHKIEKVFRELNI